MTWSNQVVHVMRKDLRQHRWVLGLLGLAVVVDTLLAMGLLLDRGGAPGAETYVSSPATGISLLAGLVATVLLVQADSPARDDAFWSTRPLSPGAVFAAKLGLVGVFAVLLPLVGQTVALVDLGVPATEFPGHLGRAVLLQASLMGGAAFLAGVTPDLRTFFVAMLGVSIGWFMVERLAWGARGYGADPFTGDPTLPRAAIVLAGGVLALLVQYRTRRLSRTLAVAGVLAGAWLVLPPLLSSGGPPLLPSNDPAATPVTAPADLIAEDLEILNMAATPATMLPMVHNSWNVRAEVRLNDASPDYDYRIRHLQVDYFDADGGRARKGDYVGLWLGDPQSSAAVGEPTGVVRGHVTSLRVGTFDDAQLAAVRTGEARIELTMAIEVRQRGDPTVLPLRQGGRTSVAGHRLTIERVGSPVLDNSVRIRLARAVEPRTRSSPVPETLRYELRRQDGTASIPLTASALGGNVGGRLVTPGTQVRLWTYGLEMAGGSELGVLEWLHEADLVIHGSEPVGTYPLTVSLTDVPPGTPDWP